ncbi:MAG TPA: rhodanese-like domain-containing protein, partial [Candidatus Thermoplasmatota archaeon]
MTDPYVAFMEAKLATEIGPHEAQEDVEAGRAVLLDCRSPESHAKVAIPGAIHIPRKELGQHLHDLPKNQTVIVYCSDIGCQSSLKATIELRKHGFTAKHMIGGIKFWQEKGYPTVTPGARLVLQK